MSEVEDMSSQEAKETAEELQKSMKEIFWSETEIFA